MDPAIRYQEVSSLFQTAVEMPAEEVEAWLIQQCDGDEDLLDQVLALLHQDQSLGPLDQPLFQLNEVIDQASVAAGWQSPVPKIPGFEIQSTIAQGSMGTVYLAHQINPEREVALKILLPTGPISQSRRRFEQEVQILARLDHPGVGKVFSAGAIGLHGMERHYFAMEYVGGDQIKKYCRDHDLNTRQIIELFINVCTAMEYVHQSNVIHRDLKPSNILVQKNGQPKIIDFGVALVLDPQISPQTMATQAGQLLGTLNYMSPEQCGNEVLELDARSDLYSLGLILFELLSGRLPYALDGLTVAGVIQCIQSQEAGLLPGVKNARLSAILHRTLEKNPNQRYRSVGQFSADLSSYLMGVATLATPPNAIQRLIAYVKRSPLKGTLVLSTVAGISLMSLSFLLSYYLASTPSYFSFQKDFAVNSLRSANGALLRSWYSNPKSMTGGQIMQPQRGVHTGRVFINYLPTATDDSVRGKMLMYDFDNLDTPIWDSDSISRQFPDDNKFNKPHTWACSGLAIDDFFEDIPGEEFLVMLNPDPFSPTSISIHDATGKLLFQVWHDGYVAMVKWVPEIKKLICTGLNSETNWADLGQPTGLVGHPTVVFAMNIKAGFVDREQWLLRDGKVYSSLLDWYKWLGPPETYFALKNPDIGNIEFSKEGDSGGELLMKMRVIRGVGFDPLDPRVTLVVSTKGELLNATGNDGYRSVFRGGNAPRLQDLQLRPYAELQGMKMK